MQEQLVGLIARHGQTDANKENRFRSWSDPPLNDKGMEQAMALRDFATKFPIKNIISSPLLRAFVTADIVADGNLFVNQHRGLFCWRLGVFTGLNRDENNDALRLFVSNPDVCIPGGESLEAFEQRQFAFWDAALKQARKDGLTLFVAHTSNVVALENFTQDNAPGGEPEMGNETVKPGGMAAIWWNGKAHRIEPIFGVEEPAKFGGS